MSGSGNCEPATDAGVLPLLSPWIFAIKTSNWDSARACGESLDAEEGIWFNFQAADGVFYDRIRKDRHSG